MFNRFVAWGWIRGVDFMSPAAVGETFQSFLVSIESVSLAFFNLYFFGAQAYTTRDTYVLLHTCVVDCFFRGDFPVSNGFV